MAAIGESVFNVAYLITVWSLVAVMAARSKAAALRGGERTGAATLLLGFALLALGDTGHVGFRVAAYIVGPDRAWLSVGGVRTALTGLGALATAYTVTFLYMLLVLVRKERRSGADAWFYIMEGLLALRLVLMALPGNAWETMEPAYAMSLLRNAPLTLAGAALACLLLKEGYAAKDGAWIGLGWSMVASYAFYLPVILFAPFQPLVGLLMIPKTLAYLAMAVIVLKRYFPRAARP
jgi:hypothetical protein